jgi:hypothetical protein
MDDPLVMGAAAGAVVALLVGIGSRLAFVHEPRVVEMAEERRPTASLERVRSHAQAG